MDVIAISLGVVVAGTLGVYLARPWWTMQQNTQFDGANPDGVGKTLNERHDLILSALRDLDFDHEVGKVTEEDYSSLRQTLLAEAAAVLTQLDESRATEAVLDEEVEVQVLAIRQTLRADQRPEEGRQAILPGNTCSTCGRPARPGDLYCAGCGTQLACVCPSCGKAVQPTDFYCASCGIELALALAG